MSNSTLSATVTVVNNIIRRLHNKGVTITPRIEIADDHRASISFHLGGDAESDHRDILLISEVLDLGLVPADTKGSYWADDVTQFGDTTVCTTVFSEVYRKATGRAKLTAVGS